MASTPKAPTKPQAKTAEPPDDDPRNPSGDDAPAPAPAPQSMPTIADEQRARSDEIASEGVDKWKAAHDERSEEEKAGNAQVPGVVPQGNPEVRSSPEAKSWEGSTRTTQAARHAQNPAASR
jgi:hypothetical protein